MNYSDGSSAYHEQQENKYQRREENVRQEVTSSELPFHAMRKNAMMVTIIAKDSNTIVSGSIYFAENTTAARRITES